MQQMPLLSVIVRTLGSDISLLKKAVKSIFANTYGNIEAIIVFQGIETNAFENLKIEIEALNENWQLQFIQNRTDYDERSKNLNLGLEAANGTYIAFLDDDDFVAPNHYENLIAAISKDNSAMAFCIAQVVTENGTLKPGLFEGRYIDKLSFYKDNFIAIHSFVITKHIVEQHNLRFDERLQLGEDYYFLLPIYMNKKVSFIKERTSFYRIVSKESQSFTAYDESGKRDQQYKLLKTLKRPFKPTFFEKMGMYFKRLFGLVYKIPRS